MKKKAALHNLGCKVNAYETEAMGQLLKEAGYELVPFEPGADLYVINTCTVTNVADRKSRQMLHKARKMNPDAIVVAAGCYVQASAEAAREDEAIDIVLGNNKKNDLLQAIEEFEKIRSQGQDELIEERMDLTHNREYEPMFLSRVNDHTRAYIKVQDGCNQFCSYCIIPYARGRVRSRRPEDVKKELTQLAENGCREVVLTGIHLSSYGVDIESSLPELICMVHEIPGIERIRLGSLEPGIITEEFARTLAGLSKMCPHFHLSLQSGCDETLKRMNRKYTAKEYQEKCEILREAFEHPALTTDVIVGFPGETEEEFEITKKFLKEIQFYETHIFKYSRRQGTRAAAMANQVLESVKNERSEELIALGEENRKRFEAVWAGKEADVLFEEKVQIEGQNYFTGYTREYLKTLIPADRDYTNCCLRGKIGEEIADHRFRFLERRE